MKLTKGQRVFGAGILGAIVLGIVLVVLSLNWQDSDGALVSPTASSDEVVSDDHEPVIHIHDPLVPGSVPPIEAITETEGNGDPAGQVDDFPLLDDGNGSTSEVTSKAKKFEQNYPIIGKKLLLLLLPSLFYVNNYRMDASGLLILLCILSTIFLPVVVGLYLFSSDKDKDLRGIYLWAFCIDIVFEIMYKGVLSGKDLGNNGILFMLGVFLGPFIGIGKEFAVPSDPVITVHLILYVLFVLYYLSACIIYTKKNFADMHIPDVFIQEKHILKIVFSGWRAVVHTCLWSLFFVTNIVLGAYYLIVSYVPR